MNFHWTIEPFGYALRSSLGHPRALLIHDDKQRKFWASILEKDKPEGGPYRSTKEAAIWARNYLIRNGHIPEASTFGDVPVKRQMEKEKRCDV